VSDHIAVDELADAAAGVLGAGRTGEVEAHVDSCRECRQTWEALAGVRDLLAAEPAPSMPQHVAQRLGDVLEVEGRLRTTAHASSFLRRPTLGMFGADLDQPKRSRLVFGALAAVAVAAVVGFGGYVLSATAGLNEPPQTSAVVNTRQLGAEAHSLLKSADLGPHRFSRAWRCARDVTSGRITAISSVVVDGEPALLVYTRSDDTQLVTVVTGCAADQPVAGPSTTLPR
jgi:anti-sigma factor RsiW